MALLKEAFSCTEYILKKSDMKLQYASDLHLEFPENKEFLRINPLKPEGDILVLAGDIVPFSQVNDHSDFFDYLSANFKLTYWLPGNHEYYHSDLTERGIYLNEKIRDNIFLVNNTSVKTGGNNLIFSTLWTRISSGNQFELLLVYSDFRVIRNNGKLLDIEQYNNLHDKCLSFLKDECAMSKQGKMIVITHHMPTFLNYPEKYKGDVFSEAFATELSDLIETVEPDYWIFGHHHTNKGDFNIGKSRMITNQLGYVMYNEHRKFNPGKIIVI
jgi:predicted phosphohydrolase